MANHKIPKIIFQTFKTKIFSKDFQEIVDSWKINNPEYEYKIYDDNDREIFIKSNFPENVFNVYNRIIPDAFKADLWRYCILYVYGGIYADVDTLCMNNIDNFINENVEFMATIDLNPGNEGYHNISNTFIAVTSKSPIILNCINKIIENVEMNKIPEFILDFSGPGILGRSLNIYLGRKETESFVNMEGVINNVKLLHFEPKIELIGDIDGSILLQNKNGNFKIKQLYEYETVKAGTICWMSSPYFK